jgi:hypothetical protein
MTAGRLFEKRQEKVEAMKATTAVEERTADGPTVELHRRPRVAATAVVALGSIGATGLDLDLAAWRRMS